MPDKPRYMTPLDRAAAIARYVRELIGVEVDPDFAKAAVTQPVVEQELTRILPSKEPP